MPDKKMMRLITLYLSGEASRSDAEKVMCWVNANAENKSYFEELQLIWQYRSPAPSFDSRVAFERLKKQL